MDNAAESEKREAMRRRITNSRVVRQLFPDNEVNRISNNDNLANLIQETIAREHEVMKQRWNFDFRNEIPLSGDYEWTKTDGANDWIGVKTDRSNTSIVKSDEENENEMEVVMKLEKTPKGEKKENVPKVRKRKIGQTHIADPTVRRKISFD